MNAEPALARGTETGPHDGGTGSGEHPDQNPAQDVPDEDAGQEEQSQQLADAQQDAGTDAGPDADVGTNAGTETDAGAEADADEGPESDAGAQTDAGGQKEPGSELSEAEAELAAQRELRERIAQRKAEKQAPIDAGAKLSGTAADLLAAVRAVESGEQPADSVFAEPAAPRRAAPAQDAPRSRPARTQAPAGPAAELVEAIEAVLAEGGAPSALATRAAAALGPGGDEQLRSDPWQLLRAGGVRPEQADGFARALLGPDCSPDDTRRGRALVLWLLAQAAVAGHTALEAPRLVEALGQRSVPQPEAAVQSAIAEGEILVFQDALANAPAATGDDTDGAEPPVRVLVGLERYALAEESLADGVARLAGTPVEEVTGAWESAAEGLSGSAAELARAVAGHALVLHTGGETARREPAALVTVARRAGLRACAAVHAPDGVRRFTALVDAATGRGAGSGQGVAPVTTVDGLLSGAEGPGRDAEGALELDLLVVLDAPQLDVETAASLVEALPDGARLVLSGDPAALWSSGPGRVFADLLAARRCPQIASRTPDPGPLGELVSGIGAGELLQVEAPGKEVVIVPVRDPGEAVHRTVQLVADSVPRTFGVAAGETQVITVAQGGPAGTSALNSALKERLNPGPGRFGGFDPGDRVLHAPAPGRALPGTVVRADAAGLHLDCEGGPVVVPREQVAGSVTHGWAVTAQQAAGSRRPTVVVVLPGDAADTLTRAWVYSAFGLAERHLSVVHGVDRALPQAVAERPAKPRTTRLATLLQAPEASPAQE